MDNFILGKDLKNLLKNAKTFIIRFNHDYNTLESIKNEKINLIESIEIESSINQKGCSIFSYLNYYKNNFNCLINLIRNNDEITFYAEKSGSDLTTEKGLIVYNICAGIKRRNKKGDLVFISEMLLKTSCFKSDSNYPDFTKF